MPRLDPVNQIALEALIKTLADQGKTIIFSTHVMQHAQRLCDKFLFLAKGRKIFDGTMAQIQKIIPPHIIIETSDDIRPLNDCVGIATISEKNLDKPSSLASPTRQWEIRLNPSMGNQAPPQHQPTISLTKLF
jgi:ABC-2 type transport system ATP-binding protein